MPNVITFSGTRKGMSDDEGARNTILGLNRIKKIGEDNGVNICIELLNSKATIQITCATTQRGGASGQEVNSPNVSSCSTTSTTCRLWKAILSDDPEEYSVDRPLPHRRSAGTARIERYAGSAMGWRDARN